MKVLRLLGCCIFNLNIYESDIVYMGGTVNYSGNLLYHCKAFSLELANVSVRGLQTDVIMKKYRDGTSVIVDTVDSNDSWYSDFIELEVDEYLIVSSRRTVVRFLVILAYLICFFSFIYVVWLTFIYGISLRLVLMALISLAPEFLFVKLFSYIRQLDIAQYRIT